MHPFFHTSTNSRPEMTTKGLDRLDRRLKNLNKHIHYDVKTPYINSPRLDPCLSSNNVKHPEHGERFESVGTRLFSLTIPEPRISEPCKQLTRTTHPYQNPTDGCSKIGSIKKATLSRQNSLYSIKSCVSFSS